MEDVRASLCVASKTQTEFGIKHISKRHLSKTNRANQPRLHSGGYAKLAWFGLSGGAVVEGCGRIKPLFGRRHSGIGE
jgi:hypothetical protein